MNLENKNSSWYLEIGNYLALNRSLLKKLGPFTAIVLSELINWERKLINDKLINPGEPFYLFQSVISQRTGFSKDAQTNAIKRLFELKLINYELHGTPRKNYYSINEGEIKKFIENIEDLNDYDESVLNGLSESAPSGLYINNKESTNNNNVIKAKELRSFTSITSTVSTKPPVETDLGVVSLLKRRTDKTLLEFEKLPRQKYNGIAMDIINYWNSSPGLSHYHLPPIINGQRGEPTKIFKQTYETIQKVLNGKFYTSVGMSSKDRPYTKEEIITAVDRFKLAATHPGFLPADKKSLKNLKLDVFFYNPFSSYVSSQFLKCLKEEPKPVTSVIKREEEKNPQLTIWIKEIYIEKVLLGEIRKFSNIEENKFIIGANHLYGTMRRLQRRENMMTTPHEWCQMVVNSLIASWGRDKVHIGHIASDYTYSETLTRYLKNKGRID